MATEPHTPTTGILLALTVLQFVKQLRRRVKPRVSLRGSSSAAAVLGAEAALGLAQWTSCLSHDDGLAKKKRRSSGGGRKTPRSIRRRCNNSYYATGRVCGAQQGGLLLLGTVDRKLSRAGGRSFAAVASDDEQFLQHSNAPIYEGCSLGETVQLLAAVQDAINVLVECRGEFGDDWLLAQGSNMGLEMDAKFVANYEHLLLRLRTDLIDAIARKAFEELLRGGHDKRQRRLLTWFTEFAEKPQPLSSSFPWTIKPSLAVLWGVCWMFYDHDAGKPPGSGSNHHHHRVPLDKVLQNINLDQWDAPASSDYVELGRQLIGTGTPQPQQAVLQQPTAHHHHLFHARNSELLESALSRSHSRLPRLDVRQTGGLGPPPPVRIHPPPAGTVDQTTYSCHAQELVPTYSPDGFALPHNPGTNAAPLTTAFPALGTDDHPHAWHPYISPQDSISRRHLIASLSNPSIRVTRAAAGNEDYPPAHTDLAVFDNLYPPEALPLNLDPSFPYPSPQFRMPDHNTLPAASASAAATMQIPHSIVKHERQSPTNSNGMQTPVSTSDPRSPLTPTPTAHARSHTRISPQAHTRQISEDRSTVSGDDERKLNYTYKRAEEPVRNTQGKLLCSHQDCTGLLFERKCEWSKHMDKHDRPYKCNVPGCEKLQGFTYSGGLLRHEREVHKLHGGTKKSLFCPFHDCKRSSGSGFTRKENLAEHIRRVHRQTSIVSDDMHGLLAHRRDTGIAATTATRKDSSMPDSRPSSTSPYSRPLEYRNHCDDDDDDDDEEENDDANNNDDDKDTLSKKRKRTTNDDDDDAALTSFGADELRAEIKRLRRENQDKDFRLRSLERAVRALQQGREQQQGQQQGRS